MADRRSSDPLDASHEAERSESLRVAVDRVSGVVGELAARDRFMRALVKGLLLSVVFDILLSFGFFYANHRTNVAQAELRAVVAKVEAAEASQHAACEQSNVDRQKGRKLWEDLLIIPQPEGEPPPDPAVLAALDKALDEAFVQQDCEA